jgi:hypothetical protein
MEPGAVRPDCWNKEASMARKSQADLTVVPLTLEGARPRPPAELDELERSIWTAIVDASPAHVIDAAAQQILRRLVAQAAVAERLEGRLRELRAQGQDHGEDAEALIKGHAEAAKLVSALMTTLRATPRSRIRSRAADADKVPISRPWERKPPVA